MRSLALLLLVAGLGSPGLAHTKFTGSTPEDAATLTAPPERVELRFEPRIQHRFSRIKVVDGDGIDVRASPSLETDDDGATVWVPLKPDLGPGTYTVSWRAISPDGHRIEGELTFIVASST